MFLCAWDRGHCASQKLVSIQLICYSPVPHWSPPSPPPNVQAWLDLDDLKSDNTLPLVTDLGLNLGLGPQGTVTQTLAKIAGKVRGR